MRVGDIMTRAVYTVGPAAPLKEVATLICRHHISGVPVLDDAGQVAGIISERDVLQAIYPTLAEFIETGAWDLVEMESRYRDVAGRPVAEFMTRRVVTAEPEMPVLRAASLMLVHRVRRLPVVQAGRLVGIISLGDVHQALFAQHFES